jgi:hypothetical protein
MRIIYKIIGFIFLLLIIVSFKTDHSIDIKPGSFYCKINGKPFVIENLQASIRTITGGEQQLSLSNDRFVKFSFLNPIIESKINLENPGRAAFIRYEEPGTNNIGRPLSGFVTLHKIDKDNNIVNGEFEMTVEVVTVQRVKKYIRITEGRLYDIPLVKKQ